MNKGQEVVEGGTDATKSAENAAQAAAAPPGSNKPEKQPSPASNAPQPASEDMLTQFCTAIRDYEGKPGDLNYQLNNPGDCRPSPDGYLAKYGRVEIIDTDTDPRYPYHKGKFAKFPTPALGWEYLRNMVHEMAANHPTWTIEDFFAHYSPTSDGNAPRAYAQSVASRCGVAPSTPLSKLSL